MRVAAITAAAVAGLWPAPAGAQDLPGDPLAGRDFVRETCIECHDVERDDDEMAAFYGPAFVDVANHTTTTETSLRVFLRTPHFEMPNFILTDRELDDVVAYILSLKGVER